MSKSLIENYMKVVLLIGFLFILEKKKKQLLLVTF